MSGLVVAVIALLAFFAGMCFGIVAVSLAQANRRGGEIDLTGSDWVAAQPPSAQVRQPGEGVEPWV